jgi:lipoprotein-anchoring transpeptidase ErfK/SrfK
MLRTCLNVSAVLAVTTALLGCVPTTTGTATTEDAAPKIEAPASVDTSTAYLATSDNGFEVPAVPVEQVPEPYRRQIVAYETDQAPGTIIINPAERVLYFVTGNNRAIRYGIAVGREGFEWSGEALITERKPWPTWTPPPEMIERKPELEEWKDGQPGGPTNPLGARALYLTTNGVDYGYRIHGTPEWDSIGSNASSGCIRMINQDVMDLYNRVPDGAKVIVMNRDGTFPSGLTLPPPQPRRETPRQTPRPARTAAPDPVVAAPIVAPPLPARLPMAPDLIVAPQPATPATPVVPAPAVAAPAVVAPATTAPAATTPVAPAPAAATAPACVPTATTPCPVPNN